jgi:hypothetical protein
MQANVMCMVLAMHDEESEKFQHRRSSWISYSFFLDSVQSLLLLLILKRALPTVSIDGYNHTESEKHKF